MAKRDSSNDDWFEVAVSDWLDPKFKGRKLKLLADAQVPHSVIQEIRSAGIRVSSLGARHARASDPDVLRHAHRGGRVLLTLDADFWDDRKYPLHTLVGGIIYVAEPPSSEDRVLRAFGLVYGCFAKSYPLNWWRRMKVRATTGEFELKMRTWQGKVTRYKMKLRRGYVVARELQV